MNASTASFLAWTARLILRTGSLSLLIFGLSWRGAAQEVPKDGPALLMRAREVSDIRREGMPSFSMEAKVTILGAKNEKYEGKVAWTWAGTGRWREEMQLPGYSSITVGGEHKVWVQRNVPYELGIAQRIDQLMSISGKLTLRPDDHVGKAHQKKEKGNLEDCVEVTRSKGPSDTFCFDATTGALLLDERSQPNVPEIVQATQILRAEYGNFQGWQGHAFPRSMIGYAGGRPVIEVSVDELKPLIAPDTTMFEPPTGATEWDTCVAPEPAVALQRPNPKYPDDARRNGATAIVEVYAEIETDGTLSHVALLTKTRPDIEKATLDALGQWRYKPESCNGNPIRVHTIITTTFFIP